MIIGWPFTGYTAAHRGLRDSFVKNVGQRLQQVDVYPLGRSAGGWVPGTRVGCFLIGGHFGKFLRGQARVDFQVVTGGVAQPEFMEGRAPPGGAGWLDDLGRC